MALEVKQKCFVIMPFSKTSEKHTTEYWTSHYKAFIKPLIESEHPLIAERSAPLRGDIVRQIITDLVTVSIVVADLTDANPNVYWELGVRQSFKHGTITIAENGTALPFDLGVKGHLFYFTNDHIKMQEFRDQFNKAINDCLNNPNLPDSQVLETISGRGTLYQILMRDESLRKLDALISEIERNDIVLKSVMKNCNENIKKKKEADIKGNKVSREYTTSRLCLVAAEMLVTSRYVDADKAFYSIAENYIDRLMAINDQLSTWESDPESTQPWLVEVQKATKAYMDTFRKQVIQSKKEIETIL